MLILLCQHVWVGGVQPGGVVLCILLFNTPIDTYITYALDRIFDTGIGVLAAMFVNGMLRGALPLALCTVFTSVSASGTMWWMSSCIPHERAFNKEKVSLMRNTLQ